ncbi:hypothetical protein AB3X52_15480 [Nocardioides sp. DS6]|uniref:DUF559 domain-containing protein n=1 Tax=Nocardioides eburneus TaxID=3231482 RepID=A0ABV3T1L2_9ACTN
MAERVRTQDMSVPRTWREVAAGQAGLLTRVQLREVGVERWHITHRVSTERWQALTPSVIATTTGELSNAQRLWLGVLHGGDGSMLGGLTAAERLGLERWHRDTITVLVPYANDVPAPLDGYRFVRSRRPLAELRERSSDVPCCQIEPAVLLFAAAERSARTAQGVLAAVVQQQRTDAAALSSWLDRLAPLRRAALFRRTLLEISGGAQSLAEMDVKRLCRAHGLALPTRQVKRRDAEGRLRFTDCEWVLPDGRIVDLEVDGLFHMEVEQWEDDLARQRALSGSGRTIVRCTSREVRDDPGRIAADLRRLGVPRAA